MLKSNRLFFYLLIVATNAFSQYLVHLPAKDVSKTDAQASSHARIIGDDAFFCFRERQSFEDSSFPFTLLDADPFFNDYYVVEHRFDKVRAEDIAPNTLVWSDGQYAIVKAHHFRSLMNLSSYYDFYKLDFSAPHRMKQTMLSKPSISAEDYHAIADSVDVRRLEETVRHLSGAEPFLTESGLDSIKTRYTESQDIIKARAYIQRILDSYGYQTELQQFYCPINYSYYSDIAFAPDQPNTGWFYLYGKIYHTTDGGDSWNLQYTAEPDYIVTQIFPLSAQVAYASCFDGYFMKTTNSGKSWQAFSTSEYRILYDIQFLNQQKGWACGMAGRIYKTENGGAVWEKQRTFFTKNLLSLFFIDDTTGWCVGESGKIMYTNNGGQNWIWQESTTKEWLYSVYFIDHRRGFVVGLNGTLLRTVDAGNNWEAVPLSSGADLRDIAFSDSLHGAIVGTKGTLLITSDGGDEWQLLAKTPGKRNNSIAFSGDSRIWITGESTLAKTDDFGLTWDEYSEDYIDFYMYNIIAQKEGIVHPDKTWIICGHYDSISDITTRMFAAPGADDNASGTAAVIEAARVLQEYDFNYTTKFILFDAEERGKLGSEYYVKQAFNAGEEIMGVINLDMISYDSDDDGIFEINASEISSSQALGAYLNDNVADWTHSLVPDYAPDSGKRMSDHASFWTFGYPAIFVIEDFDDFAVGYHSLDDIVDYLNFPYYLQIVRLAIVSLAELAEITDPDIDVAAENSEQPQRFSLSNPYPNPFNPATQIRYSLSEDSVVKLAVHNINGQQVAVLVNDFQRAGQFNYNWQAHNIANGIYIIKLSAGNSVQIRKCLLLK